jgi:hypothetical protein
MKMVILPRLAPLDETPGQNESDSILACVPAGVHAGFFLSYYIIPGILSVDDRGYEYKTTRTTAVH